jgi:Skp family chaperone for outer membrane proteins
MTKRWFGPFALVLLATVVLLSRRSDADEPRKEPAPTSKTAYLNLSYVVKNYQKFIDFGAEMKELMLESDIRVKGRQVVMELLKKELKEKSSNLDETARKKLEQAIAQANRDMEDSTKASKELLTKRNDEFVVHLYKEVQEAVIRYAEKNGVEAVFHFNDLLASSPDYYGVTNVTRKLQAGAAIPLYIKPELDISVAIVTELNAKYKPMKDE